jgi:hypothetical protein
VEPHTHIYAESGNCRCTPQYGQPIEEGEVDQDEYIDTTLEDVLERQGWLLEKKREEQLAKEAEDEYQRWVDSFE